MPSYAYCNRIETLAQVLTEPQSQQKRQRPIRVEIGFVIVAGLPAVAVLLDLPASDDEPLVSRVMIGARLLLGLVPTVNVATEPDPPDPSLLMISVGPVPCVDAPPAVPVVAPNGADGATALEPATPVAGVVVLATGPADEVTVGGAVTVDIGAELGATESGIGVEITGVTGSAEGETVAAAETGVTAAAGEVTTLIGSGDLVPPSPRINAPPAVPVVPLGISTGETVPGPATPVAGVVIVETEPMGAVPAGGTEIVAIGVVLGVTGAGAGVEVIGVIGRTWGDNVAAAGVGTSVAGDGAATLTGAGDVGVERSNVATTNLGVGVAEDSPPAPR